MSRRNQDIPIRPRYGIAEIDDSNEQIDVNKGRRLVNNASSSKVVSEEMSSSYSEIPFLAQYATAMPQEESSDITQKESVSNAHLEVDSYLENDSPDDDDEKKYSEDSSTDNTQRKKPQRPKSLQCDSSFPYELEQTTSNDGEMRHFVAENLEEQLRTGSPFRRDQLPYVSHNSTPSTSTGASLLTRHYLQTQVPQIDANVLSDIELEAQYLASAVDNLLENLCNLLHSISSITADNVEVHRSAVNKLTDSMDANIKCMYTIMAKTEEITKAMKPTEQLGQKIRDIRRLVDVLDTTM